MASSRGKRLLEMCLLNETSSLKKQNPTCTLKQPENNATEKALNPDPPANIEPFDIMSMPIDILEDNIIISNLRSDLQVEVSIPSASDENITNSNQVYSQDFHGEEATSIYANNTKKDQDGFTVDGEDQTNKDITDVENDVDKDNDFQPENDINNASNSDSEKDITFEMGNKKKRENIKKINKTLREKGKSYLGYRRPAGQSRTFQDTQRGERKIGHSCKSKFCEKSSKRQCNSISEENRNEIFLKFWNELSWAERKIYVINLINVEVTKEKKAVNENSRREFTLKYHLKIKDRLIPVCKKMFISTLSLKERSIFSWISNSTHGMSCNSVSQRVTTRSSSGFDFLNTFLKNLNKVPSHYCRRESEKLYLEQSFSNLSDLYNAYKMKSEESNEPTLSRTSLIKMLRKLNISLYQPKKDRCDICLQYELNNLTQDAWISHRDSKERARAEKSNDKKASENGICHTITMDLQAVKICPAVNASAAYYKTKLCVHNYTIFNLTNKHCTCYWFNESEADLQASVFASCLTDYIKRHLNDSKPVIIYSDGCSYQNKNSVMANALLHLSSELKINIEQKYLIKGHTQMECDSVHALIERKIKNKSIYLPSDYSRLCLDSRKINPYETITLDHSFFRDFKKNMSYHSVRPGRKTGDPTVNDIRALQYLPEGKIKYKIQFDDAYTDLPIRPTAIQPVVFPRLFNDRLPIKKTKYDHLQQMKPVIPSDCWTFYDNLPYSDK